MHFCVKSFIFRKGVNVSRKLFLSKKRTSGIAYVYDKLGFYNNFTHSLSAYILFLNKFKFMNIGYKKFKMNKQGYKTLSLFCLNIPIIESKEINKNFFFKKLKKKNLSSFFIYKKKKTKIYRLLFKQRVLSKDNLKKKTYIFKFFKFIFQNLEINKNIEKKKNYKMNNK